jgi:hypothetical protein
VRLLACLSCSCLLAQGALPGTLNLVFFSVEDGAVSGTAWPALKVCVATESTCVKRTFSDDGIVFVPPSRKTVYIYKFGILGPPHIGKEGNGVLCKGLMFSERRMGNTWFRVQGSFSVDGRP